MPSTIRDLRKLEEAKAHRSQELAREALERVRTEALAASDEDLARQAAAASTVDWTRIGASLQGRIAVHYLAAAAERASSEEQYLTTGAAASELGVSINTLKKWVRLGLIRDAYRTEGGHLRLAAADVARVVALNRAIRETPDLRPIEDDRPPAPWAR